jgi:hypothetical protein
MTIHALSEYLKYRWQARTRHGTHSPFVYSFIEQCLRQNAGSLQGRIERFIIPGHIIVIEKDPLLWEQETINRLELAKNDDAVLIGDIHKTKLHTLAWNRLITNSRVQLSIDVYAIGLLFVKKEFKEKQHFTIK